MEVRKFKPLIIVAMLLAVNAQARIINVPSDYKLIGDALGNADAGDTIRVARGVYNENITLIMGVVLEGADPLTTIIDGGRRGPTVNGTSGGEIRGFTIRNGVEGILCENAAPMIQQNWVIDNHSSGIAAFISMPHIRNNVIYGNRWSGLLIWGAKGLKANIEQNVVIRNGYSGLTLKGPTNVTVRNNIFVENHFYGIYADPAAGQTKVEHNNIYKNYYPFNRFIKVPRTNLAVEPQFKNRKLSRPDYFVSSRSPLVKRGKGRLDIGLIGQDEFVVIEEEPAPEVEEEEIEEESESISEEPDEEEIAPPEEGKSITIGGIEFDSGRATLSSESDKVLNHVYEMMNKHSDLRFKIVGHTDSQGNRQKNRELSLDRAKAVKQWLENKGIDSSRLQVEGRGHTQPIADNKTAEGRAQNRRIEFVRL